MENISGNLKGVTMVQLENWLNLGNYLRSDLRAKILDSYRIFAELVQNPKLNNVFKKPAKISPVEFTTIALLIFVHKDTMSMAQLSAAIAKMREDVRATYEDIVMCSELQDTMIDFIKSLMMAKIPAITGGPTGVAGSTAGLKRKRAKQQSDGEEEREEKDDKGKKRGKQGDQKSKAKESSTTTTYNAKPSCSTPISKVSLPRRVKKAEPGPSPFVPTQVPKPPPVRMAALGDTIAQKQQQPSTLPVVPRALPKAPSSLTGLGPPNPQMPPSPSQSFSVLSSPNLSLPNDTSNQNDYTHTPNNTNYADSNILDRRWWRRYGKMGV
jgi:hypothetical protein